MTTQTKTRILLLSILCIFLLIIVAIVALLRPTSTPTTPSNPSMEEEVLPIDNTRESEVTAPVPVQDAPRTVVPGTADQGLVAKQTARTFVERFGTYSSQNNNDHIAAVEGLVTTEMWQWVTTQYQDQTLARYQGMMTEVIASTLTVFDNTSATVRVETRQTIETESGIERQERNGTVTLVLQNDRWRIDGFYWDRS